MSKVLRIYSDGDNNITDWGSQSIYPYDASNRANIQDPKFDNKHVEITSIPSPFARMQLVKDAFEHIVRGGNLDSDDIYGRLVSETLDVGQLFFNYEQFSDKLDIIACDMKQEAESLFNDDSGHKIIGDVLQKYMASDAASLNFTDMKNIYILVNKSGTANVKIIGATSPRTIFFNRAFGKDTDAEKEDIKQLSKTFSFGTHNPFDGNIVPLYKRNLQYIIAWFYLRHQIGADNFAKYFPEVDGYLTLTRDKLPLEQRQEIDNIGGNLQNLNIIQLPNSAVEVLGHNLYKKVVTACVDSGFEMKSGLLDSKKAAKPYPLVLPVEKSDRYSKLKYTDDLWGKDSHAPYFDKKDLSNRVLPSPGNIKQPYLVISDFLEDYIIRVPHEINSLSFFDGNLERSFNEHQVSYLLPLKKRFFEYFTADELIGNKMITITTKPSGNVEVTLRIPIRGNQTVKFVEYSRYYLDDGSFTCMPSLDDNKGAIRQFDFCGLVMPNYRFQSDAEAFYTVSCVSGKSENFNFHIYKDAEELDKTSVHEAMRNQCNPDDFQCKAVNYTIEKKLFDFIQVSDENRNIQGVIVPKFIKDRGNSSFAFSVDLGTSNTLIEYAVTDSAQIEPRVFEFGGKDTQVCTMFVPYIKKMENGDESQLDLILENQLIAKDFLPQVIKQGTDYRFPVRTVLSAKKNINWDGDRVDPFSLANIPFTYGKERDLTYNCNYLNIKWDSDLNNSNILDKFVSCLMIMIRNKVVLNNGDLSKTNITWFYPISMEQKRKAAMERIWREAFHKYINSKKEALSVSESSAPVKAFYHTNPAAQSIVSVDIGGGTTDIAFSKQNGELSSVTSFRFATNDLFGTPFAKVNDKECIVTQFKEHFEEILNSNQLLQELKSVFSNSDNTDPVNMASFLFSLKDCSAIQKSDIDRKNVDFDYILQIDTNYKIVFLLYYSAIIYHLAKIIKVRKEQNGDDFSPHHLTFSGNGSKIINVLTPDVNVVLTNYTRLIISNVAGVNCDALKLLGLDDGSLPKEATCKGGLMTDGFIDDRNKRVVLNGAENEFVVKPEFQDNDVKDTVADRTGNVMFVSLNKERTYGSITNKEKKAVVEEVGRFFDFILNNMNNKMKFADNFMISQESLDLAKMVCKENLETYLDKGLSAYDAKEEIAETTFFYPIKGVLYALSKKIYEKLHNK